MRLVATVLSAVALIVAAGCGDDDDGQAGTDVVPTAVSFGSASATPASSDPAPTAPAYPVTIGHKFGETTIPEPPQRVVSLGYTEQDAIVAFGIEPIAVRYAFGPEDDVFFPWADAAAGDIAPVILARAEINIEQIAALEPDVIMAITAGLTEEQYDTLRAIAPVVVQPAEYVDFGTPWQVQTLVTGEVFDQREAAEAMVADVEAAIEAARTAHPEFAGVSVAVSGPTFDGAYPFHSSADPRGRFFTDLGFTIPTELDELAGDQFYGTVSKEHADLLDTDLLALQAGSPEEKAAIETDPILAALPVVGEGRAVYIEGIDYDAFQFVSVLSLPHLLAHFVPTLAAAVDAVG
jgi:iron complex transport system substrate-binding protein